MDLARNGASVLFTYLKSAEAASGLEEEIKRAGGRASAFKADSKDYTDAKKTVDEAIKIFGSVDILVNNAGVIKDKALMFMEPAEWQEVIDTNLPDILTWLGRHRYYDETEERQHCKYFIGGGRVQRQANYSSAKAGILGLTKSLPRKWAVQYKSKRGRARPR